MSGDPAGPIPAAATPGRPLGTVIHLDGRRPPSPGPSPGEPVGQDNTVTPDDRLAEVVETLFVHRELSLSDPSTAAAFDATLEAVVLLVDGAASTGHLGGEQHEMLTRQLVAMRAVPDSFR